MQIAKWGNSLAVRIPADVVRELGAVEGDQVTVRALGKKEIGLVLEKDRREALIEHVRSLARPLPADFKFDRDEANAR